jgi:predicted amidohydrolase YtcJ
VGKLADIAVLDQDLLTAPEDAIPDIRADLVVVGGAVVLETASEDVSGSPGPGS